MPLTLPMNANSIIIALVALVAIALVHYSYVDFRFRFVEGVKWFWLMNPAPPLLWASRVAFVLSVLLTLASIGLGQTRPVAIGITGLFLAHIALLVLIELRHR